MALLLRRWSPATVTSIATVASSAALAYHVAQRPQRLDSAATPRNALSFPYNMIASQQLTVTKTEQVNHDTKRITFALPTGTNATGVPPGAAILTQHTPPGGWFPVFRPYTPIPAEADGATLNLLVKKYPGGKASGHLHSLQPGQTLKVRGPLPGYAWKPSSAPCNVLLVAGGAGITPVYSLLQGILGASDDRTNVQLLWGVNGTRDIVLQKELEDLQSRYADRLHVTYIVSGPEGKPDAPSLGDESKFRKGYIDGAILTEAIRKAQNGQWGDAKGTKVFMCGPPKMQEAIAGKKGLLVDLGVEKKAIHLF